MPESTFTREELEEHAAGADSTMCGPSFRHCLAAYALALLDRAEAAERERDEWQRRWSEENANLDAVIADHAAALADARRDAERLRANLAIFVHAHRTGNSVPPHIEAEAAALAAKETPR